MTGISNESSRDVYEQHREAMRNFQRMTRWEQQLLDGIAMTFAHGWRLTEKQAFHLKLIYDKARLSEWQQFKDADCGMRLPSDWQPSPADLAFASGLGVDALQIVGDFKSYWHGRGDTACKSEWSALWRYWCRSMVKELHWFYLAGFMHCVAVNYGPFEGRPRARIPIWGWRQDG